MCDASATDKVQGKGVTATAARLCQRRCLPNKARRLTTPKSVAFPDHITRNELERPRGGCTVVVERNIKQRYDDDHLPKEFRTRPALQRVIRMMPQWFIHD